MSFERLRADVAAANLASMHMSAPSAAQTFKPMRVVAGESTEMSMRFRSLLVEGVPGAVVARLEPTAQAARQVLDPSHPHADVRGMVHYPGVDLLTETVSGLTAQRGYEANVAAFNTTKTMTLKALDIGKSQ
jgi:flagellar basal-body rod protein FlgC